MAKNAAPPREWVPSCFLLVHNEHVATSIRFTPMHICRIADVTYKSEIKIYGRSPIQPVWEMQSGPMHVDDVFSIDSSQIARELGVTSLLAYGEAYSGSPDMPPPTDNVALNLQVHYRSDDGSFRGHLASFFIFGAPRSVVRGESYYESFPAARIDGDHQLSAFIVNPFLRPCCCRVHVQDAADGPWASSEFTVRGKSVAEWSSAEAGYPGSPRPVGVIVESDLKTTSFFATRTADRKMIGLDHGHPFLAQVLAS